MSFIGTNWASEAIQSWDIEYFEVKKKNPESAHNLEKFFGPDESLCHAEQNGEKIFVFGQNWNFLWIFKLPKKQGLKTHYRGAEFAQRVWVECDLWCKTRASVVLISTLVLELKTCLRNVLSSVVATFETRRKALSFIPYPFMAKVIRKNIDDERSD